MSRSPSYRVPCPRCAGPISGVDGAEALDCPHCRARFFVGDAGGTGWLVEPALRPRAAVDAAKRWLRARGRRVTGTGDPEGVLVPLYWTRGVRFVWEMSDPSRRVPLSGTPPPLEAGEPDVWEARSSVRAFDHAIPAHPLARSWRGGSTRLGVRPLAVLDPDRLPAGYRLVEPVLTPEDAGARADVWREGRKRLRAGHGVEESASVPLHRRLSLVLVPLVLAPFSFRDEEFAVAVDGLSGRAVGEAPLPEDAPAGEGADWRSLPLLPLECGECGWELTIRDRDRLYPCPNCGICWELGAGRRRRVKQWFLDGEPGRDGRWLPFWAFGEAGSEGPAADCVLVPAYEARHLEEQMRLAVRLSRTPRKGGWCERRDTPLEGAAYGSGEAAGWLWAVRGAAARRTYAEFLRFLRRGDARPEEAPAGLAWIPFRREGGDLVEPGTGVRTRARSAEAWGSLAA